MLFNHQWGNRGLNRNKIWIIIVLPIQNTNKIGSTNRPEKSEIIQSCPLDQWCRFPYTTCQVVPGYEFGDEGYEFGDEGWK